MANHRRQVAEHLRNPKAAHVLGQIAPVRSDVAKRRRGAAFVGLEPPGIVGILEEPVLQIVAVQKVRRADVASSNGQARLLDERIPR